MKDIGSILKILKFIIKKFKNKTIN